jgi:hypothetical protein
MNFRVHCFLSYTRGAQLKNDDDARISWLHCDSNTDVDSNLGWDSKGSYQILRRFARKLLLRRRWAALLHAAGASPQKAFAAGKIPLPASLRSGLVRQGTRLGSGSRGGRAIPSLQA